jgi:hypothetical protein
MMGKAYFWPWRWLLEPLVSRVVDFATKIYDISVLRREIHDLRMRWTIEDAGFKTESFKKCCKILW